ncbi:MAG TPA: hypothetical protein PKZ24_07200 [Nitrospirales bacterium]|nr:hypothetical protein [Nitrospirales bacterium]
MIQAIFTLETPDVLHLALIMPDGVGMETVGTVTGIRPRGLNLAFVGRAGKAQTLAPSSRPKGQTIDCGP